VAEERIGLKRKFEHIAAHVSAWTRSMLRQYHRDSREIELNFNLIQLIKSKPIFRSRPNYRL